MTHLMTHRALAWAASLTVTLGSDPEHTALTAFGVWAEKSMYGKTYMGANRTTFIIDKTGNIAHVFEKVKPEGHDQEVLQYFNAKPPMAR